MRGFELTENHRQQFAVDGFVIVRGVLDINTIEQLRRRFERLFAGDFETGVLPDEINWQAGRDPAEATRQICNGWKADRTIAATVLRADIGRACATLGNWRGARINQDNVLWKPPGAGTLGFHQDSAYEAWVVPDDMVSCWMALDDTSAAGGTIEYYRGSHHWGAGPRTVAFHRPDEPTADVEHAARRAGIEQPERVPITVNAGDAVFHHGWTFHGSGPNRTSHARRALVTHCMSCDARFHETEVAPVYSRYKRFGETAMDESFFPILWRDDDYRSPFLDRILSTA